MLVYHCAELKRPFRDLSDERLMRRAKTIARLINRLEKKIPIWRWKSWLGTGTPAMLRKAAMRISDLLREWAELYQELGLRSSEPYGRG